MESSQRFPEPDRLESFGSALLTATEIVQTYGAYFFQLLRESNVRSIGKHGTYTLYRKSDVDDLEKKIQDIRIHLMTVRDLSRIIGISRAWVYDLIKRERIPAPSYVYKNRKWYTLDEAKQIAQNLILPSDAWLHNPKRNREQPLEPYRPTTPESVYGARVKQITEKSDAS